MQVKAHTPYSINHSGVMNYVVNGVAASAVRMKIPLRFTDPIGSNLPTKGPLDSTSVEANGDHKFLGQKWLSEPLTIDHFNDVLRMDIKGIGGEALSLPCKFLLEQLKRITSN